MGKGIGKRVTGRPTTGLSLQCEEATAGEGMGAFEAWPQVGGTADTLPRLF